MSNKPVPAAATGLPKIDRRAALAGSATLLATAAVSTLGVKPTSAASVGTPLAELMKAHKDAYARLDRAIGIRNELHDAEDKIRRKSPVLVPLAVMPNGECRSGYYELRARTAEEIRQAIIEKHDDLRHIHCSEWSRVMFPELSAAADRELNASQERALQALADAEALIETRKRNSGLTAAEEAVSAAEGEEFEARLSLAVYVPRNAAEVAAKREYIEKSPPFCDAWCTDSAEFVDAMIARIGRLASV